MAALIKIGEKIMKELGKIFRKSEKKKQLQLLIAYTANVILITLFLMLSAIIDNIAYEQGSIILFSVILVSGITILFFQWVMGEMFRALYESRRTFNISFRLAGMPKYKLYKLYLTELFIMQIKAIPLGVLFSFLLYTAIAFVMQLPQSELNIKIIAMSIVIHLSVILLSALISLKKANKFSAIELLRGKQENTSCYKLTVWDYIKAAAGMMLLLSGKYLRQESLVIAKISALFAIILFQNVLFVALNTMLEWIGRLCGFGKLMLAQSINRYSYKRTKAVISMMIFGLVMTIGLQAAYLSIRAAVAQSGENNIHYKNAIILNEPVPLETVEKERNLGLLKFFASSALFPRMYIQGINDTFLEKYETIELEDTLSGISAEELRKKAEDENWNGILLPQGQVSKEEIGKPIIVSVNGQELEFVIEGGYYSNNYSELRCLVGNSYLEKETGMEGAANIIFSFDNIYDGQYAGSPVSIQSKDDLVKNSAEKVIKGTELIELSVGIIYLSSLVMLISYVCILSREKRLDYVKLRASGLPERQTMFVFFLHFGIMIIFSLIIALPCVGILASAIGDITYHLGRINYPITYILAEMLFLLLLPVAVFMAVMQKVEKNVYLELRSIAME